MSILRSAISLLARFAVAVPAMDQKLEETLTPAKSRLSLCILSVVSGYSVL